MNFSIELAQQLIDSESRLPVSFDLAWQWIGYSRKDNAKQALLNAGFIENEDLLINQEPTTIGIQANLNENIFLTVECFKMWAMMAKTAQGKQVRPYFIECERLAKQAIASKTEQSKPELTPAKLDLLRSALSSVSQPLVDGYIINETKNPTKTKTDPAYLPTQKGKDYSSKTLATGRGEDNTSYQHIKWNESIVEVLKELM